MRILPSTWRSSEQWDQPYHFIFVCQFVLLKSKGDIFCTVISVDWKRNFHSFTHSLMQLKEKTQQIEPWQPGAVKTITPFWQKINFGGLLSPPEDLYKRQPQHLRECRECTPWVILHQHSDCSMEFWGRAFTVRGFDLPVHGRVCPCVEGPGYRTEMWLEKAKNITYHDREYDSGHSWLENPE